MELMLCETYCTLVTSFSVCKTLSQLLTLYAVLAFFLYLIMYSVYDFMINK